MTIKWNSQEMCRREWDTIIRVEDIDTLGDIITNYDQIVAGMGHGMSSNNAKFNEELEKLVDELY